MIVSLKRDAAVLRSYRIVDGEITEEPVGLTTPAEWGRVGDPG